MEAMWIQIKFKKKEKEKTKTSYFIEAVLHSLSIILIK